MIQKIFIPTLGRVDNQITYDGLPDKWKEKTSLIVQMQEVDQYDKSKYNLIVLPEELGGENGRCARSMGFIIDTLRYEFKYAIFDDDVSFVYTNKPKSKVKPSNRPLEDDEYDYLFESLIPSWMDEGYVHIGLESTINIARDRDYQDNFRISQAVFYDGSNLKVDEIDWWRTEFSADFDCNLQLLRAGFKNRVSCRYRISTSPTQAPGGCSLNRTVERHNRVMRQLKENHKEFVSLYEKENLMEKGDSIRKLGAKIAWKKAYKSSQSKGNISSFLNFD